MLKFNSFLCSQRRARRMLAVLLPVVWLHLLTPVGFMPAHGAPLSLEICPEGFPAALLAQGTHHHHGGGGGRSAEHCVFGMASGSGPLAHTAAQTVAAEAVFDALPSASAAPPLVRLVHLPAARGPPALV